MPELPEVEVIRRGLEPLIRGRRVEKVLAGSLPLRHPIPRTMLNTWVAGATVMRLGRRAKYLVFTLDNQAMLIIHLGMTGKLCIARAASPLRKHDHVRFLLDNGRELRFNDSRRFGLLEVYPPARAVTPGLFADLGPEPFDSAFTGNYLRTMAKGRKQPVKNFLMTNRVVVGIGNIYANEILFQAGIRPTTPAGKISLARMDRIAEQSRTVLRKAIKAGGTTIADFENCEGNAGYFQLALSVYGRTGQPCLRCATPITKKVMAGRATYFCPCCQK